jgi:hypothetical protein
MARSTSNLRSSMRLLPPDLRSTYPRSGSLALAETECQSSVMTEPPSGLEPAVTFALGPWREVRSGVHVAVAEPESVNLGLIVGSQRALLVDTGSSPDQGRALCESVAAVTDLQVTAVVVTALALRPRLRARCVRRSPTSCP